VILALKCYTEWEIEQIDVTIAVLNARVEKDIYMEQPQGHYIDGTRLLFHLKKTLYNIRETLLIIVLLTYGLASCLRFCSISCRPGSIHNLRREAHLHLGGVSVRLHI
jgi:hypothetical protein